MPAVDPIDERAIQTLHESIQPLARELLRRAPVDLMVVSAFRSEAEQAELYALGRTKAGNRVTGAKPGFSWHNYGLAFDVAPVDDRGEPYWPEDDAFWNPLGQLGRSLGLKWGGDFGDRPHFEYHPGFNINAARAGQRPEIPTVPRTKRRKSGMALGILVLGALAFGASKAVR